MINRKYKIIDKIKEGSFGVVFKGENSRTNKIVAIKVESKDIDKKTLKKKFQFLFYWLGRIRLKRKGWDFSWHFGIPAGQMIAFFFKNSLDWQFGTCFSARYRQQNRHISLNCLANIFEL